MKRPLIIVNTVVRNEECWVWFSLKSVLPFVNSLMVWDTGSQDQTVSIIKTIRSAKLLFKQVPTTKNETELSQVRQKMLLATKANWLMILDGDEVWPETSMQEVVSFIEKYGHKFDSIVVPTLNCVGDIYNVSPSDSGRYKIAGKVGHYNLRFINLDRVKGLHVDNQPGKLQSYFDGRGVRVQDRSPNRIAFLDAPYLHMTHLTRSRNRKNELNVYWRAVKKRVEIGQPMPKDFEYPKVFNLKAPIGSAKPKRRRSWNYLFRAYFLQPVRTLKHLLF